MTIDYWCEHCQLQFEIRRRITDDALPICPHCTRADVRRIYAPVAMISRGADGNARSIGGNTCGSCAATSCAACSGSRN